MKKLLTIAAASLAFAAVAEYVPQQIGVTTITANAKNMVIPVPFESLNGGEVSAKDLVKTTSLKKDTWMLAFVGNSYSAWKLDNDNGQWISTAIADTSTLGITAQAKEQTLSAGSAIWIILPDEEKPDITVYGAYNGIPSLTVTKGTTALVANPKQEGSAAPIITNAAKGDMLTVINGNGTFTTYTCNNSGVWGRWVENPPALPTWEAGLPTILAGSGFWYKSSTNATENLTISW